jgi:galactonate dehydratase
MRITQIDTIRIEEFPNVAFVQIHTDEGHVGLGEAYFGARSVVAWVEESATGYLLGQDPLQIERHWHGLRGFLGFVGSGVENRGRAMIDMALWDILGQVCEQPLHQLLGGATRDRVRAYNTCAGNRYTRKAAEGGRIPVSNWGRGGAAGPYEDLDAFMTDAGALAQSLLDEGFTAMKIWPLDIYAEASGGQMISLSDLNAGLEPFRRIRATVGDRIDIMCELHSLWSANAALRICQALEDLNIFWVEDPIAKMSDTRALADLRRRTRVPICGSETLGGAVSFRQLLEADATDVIMLDLAWCGGLTEGRKIAALAEAYAKPLAPHDCTGPVTLMAGLQLALHAPTAIFQEVVRATLATWYRELVTELPVIVNGMVQAPVAPGLGTSLLPEVRHRQDVLVREFDGSMPRG